ncbi:MAG TPA: DUF4433 domain-containing protein [Chthonomonas sp.]|jgi:hypothetical protein|uniref:DUF4433 domain-containing protein n=1 Tax=Chthonomonas sp. TaxID=2282153 RepID=UPI002B4AD1CD|nr:DUF4433 domain-containing protein [Chthonomonas sp.]HLH80685.1 DUF4433 domain-containing protein [Chthonomonas sp.]
MQRNGLKELHYITPCQNVPYILKYGILSYNRVRSGVRGGKLRSVSVSMPEVQRLREQKCMPNGRPLHDYVNLYFCARNPMLYKRKNLHEKLCVLRVAPSVLDIKGAVISDRNAACASANFYPSPEGLVHLDPKKIFARVWYHPFSKKATADHASIKCAELLVPDVVPASYILGAYVSCQRVGDALRAMAPPLSVRINAYLFFLREQL